MQRATGLASLEEGDAVLLRCALAAAYDSCRRREAALAEALRAVEAESTNAAALTTLGLLELPRQRTSALVTLILAAVNIWSITIAKSSASCGNLGLGLGLGLG